MLCRAVHGSHDSFTGIKPRLQCGRLYLVTKGSSHLCDLVIQYLISSPPFRAASPTIIDRHRESRSTAPLLLLPLHRRLQPKHLHLHPLALTLRLPDLLLQPLDLPLYEVEAALDGHDGFAALLFQEDGADERGELGGGR